MAKDNKPNAFTFSDPWEAIHDDPDVAQACREKSDLLMSIQKIVAERNYSRKKLAKLFNITKKRARYFLGDGINRYLLSDLIFFKRKLGYDVKIVVKKSEGWRCEKI